MKKNILITCFENFLDNLGNPTPLIAEDLKRELSLDYQITILKLPVSFSRSFDILNEYLKTERPQYIFELGLASNRNKVGLEKFGLNYISCPESPDNDGHKTVGEKIESNSQTIIENSHFNLEEKFVSLKNKGLKDLEISAHAGTYVCNYLYYKTLLNHSEIPSLFIHIPQINEIDERSNHKRSDLCQKLKILIKELCH